MLHALSSTPCLLGEIPFPVTKDRLNFAECPTVNSRHKGFARAKTVLAMSLIDQQVIHFDGFRLDLGAHRLSRGGDEIALRPKSFDFLSYLARNPGRLVSKDELFANVWEGVTVTDDSLVQCVREIRMALDDDERVLIKTVPKRGYVFTPKANPPAEQPPETGGNTRSSRIPAQKVALAALATLITLAVFALGPIGRYTRSGVTTALEMMATPTIAVSPFVASPGRAADLAQSFADQLSTALPRVPRGFDMEVKSAKTLPNADHSPSILAKQLNVRYVVTGTLDVVDAVTKVAVHLIEAPHNHLVWTSAFDVRGGADELRLLSTRLARQLAVQIRTIESNRRLPDRPAAGHYVIQGRVILEGERGANALLKAKGLFDKAVALEPSNVQALAGYARSRTDLAANLWVSRNEAEALLLEAEAAANKILEVDQNNITGHLLRGVTARLRGYHERSLASLERALELNPTYALLVAEIARTKIDLGLYQDTMRLINEAITLSPNDPASRYWSLWYGIAAIHLRDYQAAIGPLLKSLQSNSKSHYPLPWLAVAYHGLGDTDKGRQMIDEYKISNPSFSISAWISGWPINSAPQTLQREHILSALRELGVPEQ